MKMSLCQMIVVVVVLTLSGISLTTAPEATWDRASSHLVTVDVYDVNSTYCHTYGYNYYVPDTTTQHYKFYHRGPAVPDTHPYPHTAILTSTHQYETEEDLDTLCDGTDPNDGWYYYDYDPHYVSDS